MNDIAIELDEKNLKNIMLENQWKRICYKCGKEQIYVNKYSKVRADKLNNICRSCSLIKHLPNEKYIKPCPYCGKSQEYKCLKSYNLSIRKNSKCRVCHGKINGKKSVGRKRSDNSKRKMRLSMINR